MIEDPFNPVDSTMEPAMTGVGTSSLFVPARKRKLVEVEEVARILIMILITLIITMSINIEIMMTVVTMTDCNAQEGSVPRWTSST